MMINDNNISVDENKVAKIIKRIISEESKNIKSGEKSDADMIKLIQKIIQEEVECY